MRKDQLLERNGVATVDAHNFALRITTRNYLDGILRQFESFCEQPLQLTVGRTFNRRRGDPNPQSAIVFANDLAAGRTRHHNYIKGETLITLGMANQDW